MLMKNNFQSNGKGRSQRVWQLLISMLFILTMGIGQMWGAATTVDFVAATKDDSNVNLAALSNGDTRLVGGGIAKLIATNSVSLSTSSNKYGYRCDASRLYIVFKFDGVTDLTIKHNANSTGARYMRLYSFSSTKSLSNITSSDWTTKTPVAFSSTSSTATWGGGQQSAVTVNTDKTTWNYGTKGCLTVTWDDLPAGYYVMDGTGSEAYIYSFTADVTSSTKYTVTFNNNGHGTAPSAQGNIASGGKATEPTAPTDDDYNFGGWWNNSNWEATGAAQWNFSTSTVTKDTTLYAKWTLKPVSTCTTPTVDATFAATATEIEIAYGDPSASTNLTFTKGDNKSDPSFVVTKGGAATTDASVLAGVFTATKAGTYTVTATQEADGTYCEVVKQVTITVTEGAFVCPTVGAIYRFKFKTDLTNGNVYNATTGADGSDINTSNYLQTLYGGSLKGIITGSWSQMQFYDQNAIGFTGGTNGSLKVVALCDIKTGYVLKINNTAAAGNKFTVSYKSGGADKSITIDGGGEQKVTFTEDVDDKTLIIKRNSGNPKLTELSIFIPYVVTLNANGGTCATAKIYAENNEKVALPHAAKDGNFFDGWYNGETPVADLYTVTADVTLTAHYTLCSTPGSIYKFSVLSDLTDGVCAEVNTFDVTVGNYLTALEGGTLTGYNNNSKLSIAHQNAFRLTDNSKSYLKVDLDCALAKCDKFKTTVADNSIAITAEATRSTDFTIADGTEEITYVPEALVGKKTFYIWRGGGNASISYLEVIRPVTHTIKFDADGGTDVDSILVETGTAATAPTAPTKDKYDFVKWVVKSTSADYDWTANVTGDLELKAIWAPWPTMTLVAGEGATGDPVATQYKAGTEITVPAKPEGFSKGTNVFDGWTYSPAVSVNEGKFEMPSTNLTLTAVWVAPSNYDVRFFQGYGEPDVQIGTTQSITVNSFATAPATDPTREGYAFLGWSYDATAEHIVNVAEYAITAATDFTAMWQKVWTVSFDGDDVVVNDGAKVSSPNSPSQAGKVFLGWYNGENKYDFSANVTANMALTSKWADVDPNHFVYAYNDDFHYDGVLYKTPEGKVDAGAGASNIALTNTAYSLFSGAAGITSVVVNNGIYDSKSGAEQGVTALVKLNTTSTSNLTVTIKAGYTAVMKVKMGSWNVATAAPTVTFKKGEDAISYTGTMEGKASDQSYAELTYNLEAGTYVMTTATKTLYFSSIDIQATALPTYAVTYAANGGEGTMTDANEYYEGAEVTLLENTFAPASGFMWSGWAVTGNVSSDPIAVSEGKFTMPAEAVTVTAQWEDVSKVAVIVETNVKYETLAAAIVAAEAGQTVQLIQDITQEEAILIDKNLTLDLNNKTFTVTNPSSEYSNRAIKVTAGTIVIENGTVDALSNETHNSGCWGSLRQEGGHLTCNNVTFKNYRSGGLGLKPVGGTLILNECTVLSEFGGGLELGNATVEVNNCTFTQAGTDAQKIYGACFGMGKMGTLTINGGTYTSDNYSFYIYTSGGTINVNSGTFAGDIKTEMNNTQYPSAVGTINISGGTFDGVGENPIVFTAVTANDHISISGGVFDTPIENQYCAEGYVPQDNGDGTYGVTPKDPMCLIKAVLSAQDDNTVATPTITVGYGNTEVGGNVKGAKTHETIVGYKFNADGAYLYVTLANGSFHAGDSVEVYMTYGAKALAVYPHMSSDALATSAASASAALGKNYVVLAEDADTLYLARKNNNAWNPNVAYIAVYRVADPMLQKFEFESLSVEGVINEAAKTVAVEVPYATDVTALTPTIQYVSNGAAAVDPLTPTGAQDFTSPVVYTIKDKDGSATAYTVTVSIAEPSTDATLSALSYGGTAISLEDGVFDYNVNLAKGTTDVPALAATAASVVAQPLDITNAAEFVNYEATSTVIVTAQDGIHTQTYTVHFSVAHAVDVLVDVTANTTWDWSLVAKDASGVDITNDGVVVSENVNGLILANYLLGENFDKIEGNNGAYAIRNGSDKKVYQGASLHMHTTVSGYLKIKAANEGHSMTLNVQNAGRDMVIATLIGSQVEYTVYVQAGDVRIYNVSSDSKPMRVSKITFTVDNTPDYTRNEMLGNGVYGTICLPYNVPAGGVFGVTIYELMGREPQYGKLAFDEIVSGEMEAGVPYVFQAHGDILQIFYGETHVDDPVDKDNGMYGTFEDVTFYAGSADDIYFFRDHALWSAKETGVKILANRAYVKLSEIDYLTNPNPAPGRRRITMTVNGEQVATDIESLEASEQPVKLLINGQIFILRGEKLYDATGRLVK